MSAADGTADSGVAPPGMAPRSAAGRNTRANSSWLVGVLAVAFAACAAPPYEPCPVELTEPLPADAFARCRELLVREYGALVEVDQAAFRLQTCWLPIADPPGERRATVFLDTGVLGAGLLEPGVPVADLA